MVSLWEFAVILRLGFDLLSICSRFALGLDSVRAWSGMDTRQYKKLKDLKKENLRDNMTNMELILNMLAEASTTEISKAQSPKGLEQNRKVARAGGQVARKARRELEARTGKSVITKQNAKKLLLVKK